ncbi:TetR/AcrR family transcriptional regulator [Cellulosimicrobium cellulans]|uniref:TetR/AcrR family transcriptional regulator n=2 Tax=Cellulosimicrobium cellulans TaxID=1710 RepID=UPI0024056935|nr:TetR family transcriptional regulator [Cellulosimicrobium cellulans]MDF9876238.1 AcrR family transcriptional regulator [Cellulosimicrobium cellulans]
MRSAQRPAADAGSVASDLTTRARIRDAAIERFARDGFGASVRSVAADVGVSHALVVHHFGSKDGLRQVCDEHVLEQIRTAKAETIVGASSGTFLQHFTTAEQYATLVGYVLRSLLDGGPLARTFVQHMVDDAEQYVGTAVDAGVAVPSRDERRRARYLTLSAMGAMLLSIRLDPPEDLSNLTAFMRRFFDEITLPVLELYTEGFLTTRRMLDDYLLYVGDPPADGGAPLD